MSINRTLQIKSVTFPDSTDKELAQEEFRQLSQMMDTLGALSYKEFMAMDFNARNLLELQYTAMGRYRQAMLARIEAWT